MYHISDDPRAKASAQRICEALTECARRKPFSEIAVNDLHREYGISRTTFYRLFDNTVDVLEYMAERMGREILLNLKGDTPKELVINAIYALQERRELIELLSQSGHLDIFQKKGEQYLPLSKLTTGLNLHYGGEYFYRLSSYMIPLALDVWVTGGKKDSPEEVYEKLCHSIQMLGVWFSN